MVTTSDPDDGAVIRDVTIAQGHVKGRFAPDAAKVAKAAVTARRSRRQAQVPVLDLSKRRAAVTLAVRFSRQKKGQPRGSGPLLGPALGDKAASARFGGRGGEPGVRLASGRAEAAWPTLALGVQSAIRSRVVTAIAPLQPSWRRGALGALRRRVELALRAQASVTGLASDVRMFRGRSRIAGRVRVADQMR